MINQVQTGNLKEGLKGLRKKLYDSGKEIKTQRWQGKESNEFPPFLEVLHADLLTPMEEDYKIASDLLEATQPWADLHFEERVSGIPYNPPPSHTLWLKDTQNFLSNEEKFSHTYPERLWANKSIPGIRFNFGNLRDAVTLLKNEPDTRQCYVPIWFPEDLTASLKGERVPCTLGWHFMLRDGFLHCFYPMRSCDVCRHLHNDLYFANRLTLWMIEQAQLDAKPGILHFSSTSLHCFVCDKYTLGRMIK